MSDFRDLLASPKIWAVQTEDPLVVPATEMAGDPSDEDDFAYDDPEFGSSDPDETRRTRTTRADLLKVGDRLCWTESDGTINPPGLITRVYNPKYRNIRVKIPPSNRDQEWVIRGHARVKVVDVSPTYNEWGEEGL